MQIAIVVYPGFTALDAIGPYEVFNFLPDRELRFVWKAVGPIVTDSGALVIGATHTFEETPAPDIVLIPGSSADTMTAAADPALRAWLQQVFPGTRYTTSVCSGAVILASAGLLTGQPATTHWAAMPILRGLGALPQPEARVVQAGKVFTAAGVSAGIDLALALIKEIHGQAEAEVAQLLIEYDPQPPCDAGHMSKAGREIRRTARSRMAYAAANPRDLLSLPAVFGRRFAERLSTLSLRERPLRLW